MSWTAPTTRTTGTLITASIWNTDVVDNLSYLKSQVSANAWLSAAGMWGSLTSGATPTTLEMSTNKQSIKAMSFADGADYYAEAGAPLPKDWNGGTITAEFYWMHPATATNFGVVWGLKARAYANDDAGDQAFGTEVTVADTGGTTSDIYISAATSAITIGGSPAAGQYVQFKIHRDYSNGSDNMAVAAYLLGALLTYTRS